MSITTANYSLIETVVSQAMQLAGSFISPVIAAFATNQYNNKAKSPIDAVFAPYAADQYEGESSVQSPFSLLRLKERLSAFKEGTAETMGSVCKIAKFIFAKPQQCIPLHVLEQDIQKAFHDASAGLSLDETSLKRFGNKHLNLVKMDRLAQTLGFDDVAIPAPIGIASGRIAAFLKKEAPKVFEVWNELKNLGPNSVSTPAAAAHLQSIHDAIIHTFSKASYEDLGLTKTEQELLLKSKFLMVRSTGAEDGKKMANAGGNVSKAYVRPDTASLCKAVGEVVASYFGKDSLQNRINAGANPFEEDLQLAVTTQPLIGEPAGGAKHPSQIPSSFVLFTNEPLYIGAEKFRVMRLSASFGHGEAVVGNQGISTDTALILHSESHPDEFFLIYDNQIKPHRLAPSQKGELEKVSNPATLVQRPALTEDEILRIYRSGVLMESYFGGEPTDIEGVVLEGKVHFVQARPIHRKPLLPTYLDAFMNPKLQAETITVGKGSVVSIAKQEEILFAPTLKDAERAYNKDLHRAVIVSQNEPANSHPVVNFSNLGVPCLFTSDLKGVQALAAKIDPDHPLAICMQTATLNLWDNTVSKLEDSIREGFAVHPAKIAISLSDKTVSEGLGRIPQEIKNLLLEIRQGNLQYLKEYLQPIYAKIECAKQKLAAMQHSPQEALDRIAALDVLQEKITRTAEELRILLKRPESRLQSLLHAKVLETLIASAPRSAQVGQLSLADTESSLESVETLLAYQNQLPFPARLSRFVLAKTPSPEASQSWQKFLLETESQIHQGKISQTQLQTFESFVSLLQKTGAFQSWSAFFQKQLDTAGFAETLKEYFGLKQSRFEKFLQIASSNEVLIEGLSVKHDYFQQMHSQIERFSDPKSFKKAYDDLKSVADDLFSPAVLQSIHSSSPITRSIAYKTLRSAIEIYDAAIKTMKASPLFQTDEKVRLFRQMLHALDSAMQHLAAGLTSFGKTKAGTKAGLDLYLNQLKRFLSTLPEVAGQLNPSNDFSVSAAMATSKALFDRHLPLTLEDLFTLLHQNSLAFLDLFEQELLTPQSIAASFLPQPVKQALALIEGTDWGRQFQIQIQNAGHEINEKEILWHYNVPLQNHSGRFTLRYDTASGKMTLKGQLLGENRRRWDTSAAWLEVLQNVNFLKSPQPTFKSSQELTFTWDLPSGKLSYAIREYVSIADYSINQFGSNLFDRFQARPEWPDLIRASLQHQNLRREAILILRTRVLQGEDLDLAAEAAQLSFKDQDWLVRIDSLELFNALAEKGHSFEAAIEAAQLGFKDKDWQIRGNSLELFKALIEKEHGFEAAAEVAQLGLKDHNPYVRRVSFGLFKALVEKGHGFEAAAEAAQLGLNDLH
jgi:hypothetical protein